MNGNFDDDEAIQNERERNKSGILQGVDHFSSTQERGIYGEKEKTPKGLNGIQDDKINKKDQADIDAINNRGKNQSTDINGKKKKDKDGDDNESSSNSSSGKKDELESKDGSKDKDSKGKDKDKDKDKNKEKSSSNNKDGKGGLFSSVEKKKAALILKIKIYFWIAVGALAIFLIFFLIAFFIMVYDNLISSVSSFFGVSESGTTECADGETEGCEDDGLFTDKKYQFVTESCDVKNYSSSCECDPDTESCKRLDSDDLVYVLLSDETCKIGNSFY